MLFIVIEPGSPLHLKLIAADVIAGEDIEVKMLNLSDDFSYVEEDVANLLAILPFAKKVRIYLSVVPLTSSSWKIWANFDCHWERISLVNGTLESDVMSDMGNVLLKAKEALLNNVDVKDSSEFGHFSEAFMSGVLQGKTCEKLTFWGSTEKVGEKV